MQLDADSTDTSRPAEDGPPSPGVRRVATPLGRGLEEVSHLFLSSLPQVRVSEPAGDRTLAPARDRSTERTGAAVLRPGGPITRETLVATVRECPGALEGDLRPIDAGILFCPFGDIDVLAVDGANRLAIIDIETSSGDWLLLRGISQLDWVMRNVALAQRLYQGRSIDFSRRPRLFLLAPGFSPVLKAVIRQIARPEVSCFRYHSVDLSGRTAILFERVGDGA